MSQRCLERLSSVADVIRRPARTAYEHTSQGAYLDMKTNYLHSVNKRATLVFAKKVTILAMRTGRVGRTKKLR